MLDLFKKLVDEKEIIEEITANPNISLQDIFTKNPKIVEKLLKSF